MRVISGIAVLGFMFLLLVSAVFSAETSKNPSGETLFKENCNSCHLNGGNVVKPKEPLKKAPQLKNFKSFLTQVRKPEAPMPAFSPAKISDTQAKELYQYILDQVKTAWK
jgi:mono/diheme cytochrome c family protein